MSSTPAQKGTAASGGSGPSTPAAGSVEHLKPGALVFAKMKSFPPWPATIISVEEYPGFVPKNHVPVKFLGSGDFGHVASKECFPYVEFRDQYGTPKQRPKHAEAIREAEELISIQSQQQSKKRTAPKRKDLEQSNVADATIPASKKPRGRTTKSKGPELGQSAGSSKQHQEEEEILVAGKMLPASQLAEIAASTVFEAEPEPHLPVRIGEAPGKKTGQREATDEDDEEYVDDAISNVVRQLEELEKQEAHEKRLGQAEVGDIGGPSRFEDPNKRRGRPSKKNSLSEVADLPAASRLQQATAEAASPTRIAHQRSMSETTDDGHGSVHARHSSGSETPVGPGDSGLLGKRRHKPKIMSEYFLEYDYGSPRTHRKSESSVGGTTPLGASAAVSSPEKSSATKTQPKISKVSVVPKTSVSRNKKVGVGGPKSTKDLEKAALEAEVERVKMAAEENPNDHSQVHIEQQLWQRQDTFGDLPFDDSMFEVTVDVEETPAAVVTNQANMGESSKSHATAKRKRDAAEIRKEKEMQKHKPKLKVKLIKDTLPAPMSVLGSSADEKRKKKGNVSIAALTKNKSLGVGKMKVQIAKKRATKAAKVVAAADMKGQKKRGRKPLLNLKPDDEKRITGYSLWAEQEEPILRQEHPELKGLRQVKEALIERFSQVPESEKKLWNTKAQRENDKRKKSGDTSPKKGKSQQLTTPASSSSMTDASGYFVRLPVPSGSPKGFTPSSPRGSRMFASPHGIASTGIEIQQQPQLSYEQGNALGTDTSVYQMGSGGMTQGAYGDVNDPNGGYIQDYGIPSQQQYGETETASPSPSKRPRGRPPKASRSFEQQKLTPRPQLRLADSAQLQTGASRMGYQAIAPASKGLKAPKKETMAKNTSQQQQAKPPLKILTLGQRRPFQVRSPPMMQSQHQVLMTGGLEASTVPEAMSHEELVYDPETAAIAAAAAAAMDMGNSGMVGDEGLIGQMAYGHMDQRGQHDLVEETETAVSYLTTVPATQGQLGGVPKTKEQLAEERAERKREARRRSRAKNKASKKGVQPGQELGLQPLSPRGQKRDTIMPHQFSNDQPNFADQSIINAPPAAYEEAYVEPRPTEEDTNVFFFGTTQDVQALLELRNPPGPMEAQCRWWLADEADPELRGAKGKGRGISPPRPLTAEPLDAAAVFKLIGRTFENVGNQLMREEGEDNPHEVAGGMDMLLDGLVSSISHLLTLIGSIPPFDRRYRRDVAARLVEDTSMMIPL